MAFDATATYKFDESAAIAAGWTLSKDSAAFTCTANKGCTGTPPEPNFVSPLDAKSYYCSFWNGETLPNLDFTLTDTVMGSNGSKWDWVQTWTYTGNTVAKKTAYVEDSSEDAKLVFNGKVAGLSAQSTSSVPRKYSFSLYDSFGLLRVSNPALIITNTTTGAEVFTGTPTFSYVNAKSVNFSEFSVKDAGLKTLLQKSGDSTLIASMTGDARTLLNTDSFAGNNDGGVDGSSLAYVELDAIHVPLAAGNYSYTFMITVKDVSGETSQKLSVTESVKLLSLKECPVPVQTP